MLVDCHAMALSDAQKETHFFEMMDKYSDEQVRWVFSGKTLYGVARAENIDGPMNIVDFLFRDLGGVQYMYNVFDVIIGRSYFLSFDELSNQ